ncbi:3-deoxy-D-manno-octulosonate cytidylyltransferase [gamma proteobacterium HdN1]|nr:3-deoxy-D-manno-octulosonate cytidylyltransferase [gamma proteobacterium HdN1]
MPNVTSFVVVIPARFASTRLPAKPLADIAGKPLIQWVYEQARKSEAQRVIIATDDARIETAARAFGAEVVMTRATHESGTDRIQEVASQLGLSNDMIIVNVQGDEPMIPPALINQVAENLTQSGAPMATLCEPIQHYNEITNPNVVKVVMDCRGMALYFSRAMVPFDRDRFSAGVDEKTELTGWYRHLGIYAYRKSLLDQFVNWGPCLLEQTEKLEQLRALWHGVLIHVAPAEEALPPGVDTPADLERIRAILGARVAQN